MMRKTMMLALLIFSPATISEATTITIWGKTYEMEQVAPNAWRTRPHPDWFGKAASFRITGNPRHPAVLSIAYYNYAGVSQSPEVYGGYLYSFPGLNAFVEVD